LLAGEGPLLKVYDLTSKKVLANYKLFPSCFKITNIKVCDGFIVVSNETSIKVLNGDSYEQLYDYSKVSLDKIVAFDFRDHLLYTVNAHNFVEIWNLE